MEIKPYNQDIVDNIFKIPKTLYIRGGDFGITDFIPYMPTTRYVSTVSTKERMSAYLPYHSRFNLAYKSIQPLLPNCLDPHLEVNQPLFKL